MSKGSNKIYNLFLEAEKKEKRKLREEILRAVGIGKEYFEEGSIKIDKRTCRGVECKLCIEACPTNALYWDKGEVKIQEELCIYCNACVLSCIVDNCIIVTRKRENGDIEKLGTPREAILLMNNRAVSLRGETVLTLLAELTKAKADKRQVSTT